jgi:hypothetical protein
MKKSLVQVTICACIGLLCTFCAIQKAYMDQWFDSYECVSWEEEALRLDNLAVYLSRNPKMKGYIAFYAGKNSRMQDLEVRIARVIDHLVLVRGINTERIVAVRMGTHEKTRTIIQPVMGDQPPPSFPK